LISVLCLFLVACSPKSQLLPEETNAISPHLEVVIEDELSGSSPPDYQVILEENNVPPPLYTISSVPPLDDEDALLTYFVGNDITSAFFYSEDEEVDTGALIAWFLQGYGFPTTTIGSYYLLTRTGDTQWSEKINQI
jgi:hypothetical protein